MGISNKEALGISVFVIGMYVLGMKHYELFHLIAEGMLSALGILLFLIVIKIKKNKNCSGSIVLIGVSFLYVAALSVIHLLAARDFYLIPIKHTIEPRMVYLWTINNLIQSITFLFTASIYRKDIRLNVAIILISYFFINSFFIYIWDYFPQDFVMGKGFSTFNLIIQSMNCILIITAIFIYIVRKLQHEEQRWSNDLTNGMIALIFSILTILLATTTENLFNIIGHLLRSVSAYFIIKFIVSESQHNSQYENTPLYKNL